MTRKGPKKGLEEKETNSIINFNEGGMTIMNVDWKQTGKKIRNIMKQKKYSIKKMANELYISESTMKNYIYAETKVPIDTLYNMTKIFKVEKIEDLLVFEQTWKKDKTGKEEQIC